MVVAVSIVSFNTKNLLRSCLLRLEGRKAMGKISIWVLDNNSEDGSAVMVEKDFPFVNLIKSETNSGFSKGQNQLIRKILEGDSKFTLLLNPDTEFDIKEIDKLTKFMDENNCGIASGLIQDLKGKLQSNGGDFPFNFSLLNWLFNLEFLNNANFHQNKWSYFQGAREVDWVGGTFMMVRSEVFEKIGLLNEDYFMYFEDVDFCYRTKKAGFKIMIYPDVKIKHISGASSKHPQYNQWRGEFAGLFKFYNQYFGLLASFAVRLLVYLAILLRIAVFFILGKKEKSVIYAKVLLNV